MHLQLVFLQKYVVRPPLPWLDAMPFYCPIVSNFALVIYFTENCLFYGLRFGPTCCRPRYKKKPWKELSHAQEINTQFTHSIQVKSPFNSQGVCYISLILKLNISSLKVSIGNLVESRNQVVTRRFLEVTISI